LLADGGKGDEGIGLHLALADFAGDGQGSEGLVEPVGVAADVTVQLGKRVEGVGLPVA
jgi:hypothetical protein